jgi:hypothetical protein
MNRNRPQKQNNLLDHPERSPNNRRLRQQNKKLRALDRPGIARDTPLMPWIIADTVCAEASRHLDSDIPLEYIDALDAKAERCYARGAAPGTARRSGSDFHLGANPFKTFRQRIRSRDNKGRAYLHAYMRHWLYAFLTRDHRQLALKLPPEFSIGRPIIDLMPGKS